jgi:hypothetical protein
MTDDKDNVIDFGEAKKRTKVTKPASPEVTLKILHSLSGMSPAAAAAVVLIF